MGLMPISLLRDRRKSFVEVNAYDEFGSMRYSTAGYLGNGYFITVKHGVMIDLKRYSAWLLTEGLTSVEEVTSVVSVDI